MDIATLRATIAALQSVVVRTAAQMADRDARIRRCRQQIADLEAQQAQQADWRPSDDYIFEGRAQHEYRLMYA